MGVVAGPAAPPPRVAALPAFAERRALAMLALGFSAGLPAALIFDTLSLWLRGRGVSLETIGVMSLVTLVYSFKFLWAPAVDRVALPLLTNRLGRRRSWMVASQVLIAAGLWLISAIDPAARLGATAGLALFVGIASATQDLAIDAWRIEASDAARHGVMAAAYQWGYRVAVLAGGAVPLILAGPLGWNTSYAVMAALTGVGIVATLVAPAEDAPDVTAPASRAAASDLPRGALRHLAAAFGDPFRDFVRRHGPGTLAALALVCTYRLPDLVRSVAGPFYLDLGFTLVEIAEVRRGWGMVMTMAGVGAGGIAIARFGLRRALVAGAVCGPAASLALAWMAAQGRDMSALVVTTALEHAAGGFAGTCLIAYMSSLTTRGFTATQYALLSSLFTLPGRLLASQSGRIVEAGARASEAGGMLASLGPLTAGLPAGSFAGAASPAALAAGYVAFFIYSAALGAAALVLSARMARRRQETDRV